MLAQLGDVQPKDDGKIVILAHDRDFGESTKGNKLDMKKALDKFLKMAKKAGFVFRKLSEYPSDY